MELVRGWSGETGLTEKGLCINQRVQGFSRQEEHTSVISLAHNSDMIMLCIFQNDKKWHFLNFTKTLSVVAAGLLALFDHYTL